MQAHMMIMIGVIAVLVVGFLAARWSIQRRHAKKKAGE
jgi:hypothetical protein